MKCVVALSWAVGLLTPIAKAQPANPISVKGYVDYGKQVSSNGGFISRDVGLEGSVGGTYFVSYADSGYCTDDALDGCQYYAGNTLAQSSFVPYIVNDYGAPPPLLCDSTSPNSRLHISGVTPISGTTGAVWYTNITYDGSACGGEIDGCPVTDGVAVVDTSTSPPTCTPLFPYWDTTQEPLWGYSVGPLNDGYVYLIGQLDGNAQGGSLNDVYLARVPSNSVFDYTKYQYWDGSQFSTTRLRNPAVTFPGGGAYDKPSILQGVPAIGSITYNAYYNVYVILAIANYNTVVAYTASLPQGPWSAPTTIYTNSSYGLYVPLYAPCAQPRFDQSGKTLAVTVNVFGRNNVDITFKATFN